MTYKKLNKSQDSQSILYSNDFMDIVLINPNYPFLKMKKHGVVAVPYDAEGNIYMLRKNRPNVGVFYELPRGFVENGEDFETGALRELLEETGMQALAVTNLGIIQPDTGLMSNNVEIVAINVGKTEDKVHYDSADKESNLVVKLDSKGVREIIKNGSVICGYTMSGVFKFLNMAVPL